MNDKQIRETLGRIDDREHTLPWLFNLFVRTERGRPQHTAKGLATLKALRALAEYRAALEEITRLKRRYAVGQTTGERAREIARRFTGGK